MAALGDSVTAGFGSCLAPTPCPRNSWSTGDGALVSSHYKRILSANPAIRGKARNLAVPGARAADLSAEARSAASHPADYVTILIGANDACQGGIAAMTPVAAFRADIADALAILHNAMPRARVLLVAIPNLYRIWEIGHTNRVARAAWKSGVCVNLLANPTSTAAADVARRQAVRDRVAAYNSELAGACAGYGARCRFDAGAATYPIELSMLSAIDFFHPNSVGQDALARQSYPGTFTW
jgi:lysophospholipase L1-like esterase